MDKCPICKAIKEDKLKILFQNDEVLAFFHISPVNEGHTLVIPREHYPSLVAVPPEIQAKMIQLASDCAAVLKRLTKSHGFNLHLNDGPIAGQSLAHCHIHVIPRTAGDGFYWNWRCLEQDEERLNELVVKVQSKLEKRYVG